MKSFQDKIVFITGASSGIGQACAKLFAQNNAKLILAARRREKLEALAKELQEKYSSNIKLLELDVRDEKKVTQAIQSLDADWQNIDVLINNAGLAAGGDKIQNANPADWDQMIDTNVKGLLYVTHAVLPNMVKRNLGHIINLGSIAGHEVYPAGGVYCATKFAVNAISRGLKLDLLGTAIRVTSIDPGMVETEFSKVRYKGDLEKAASVYAGFTPLSAEDIADSIFYCASCPPHVNILEMIIFPTDQSAATQVFRRQ
jgi:3-hydroxy acid dehydrogenase / malonic semialdehyde reductase